MINQLSSGYVYGESMPNFTGKGKITKKVMFKVTDEMSDVFEYTKKKFTQTLANQFSRSVEEIESLFEPKQVEQLNRDFKGLQQIYKGIASLRKIKMMNNPDIEQKWNPLLNRFFQGEFVDYLQRNKLINEKGEFQNLPARFIKVSKGRDFIDDDLAKQANRVVVGRGVKLKSPTFKDVTLKGINDSKLSFVAENAKLINSKFGDGFVQNSAMIKGSVGNSLVANDTIHQFGDKNKVSKTKAGSIVWRK